MWTVILFTCAVGLGDCDMKRLPMAFSSEDSCEEIITHYLWVQKTMDDLDRSYKCVKKE